MSTTSLENAIYHCTEKVCPELSSLHYALLFQPQPDKAFWLGMFTLLHEIRRATQQQLEAGLTQVKLGWWRHALVEASQGTPNHPVLVALGPKALQALTNDEWSTLIEETVLATEMSRHDSLAGWLASCRAPLPLWFKVVKAHYGLSESESLGEFWAASTALTQVLRLAKYLEHGFQPIPIQWLEKHGVTAEQIKQRQHDKAVEALFKQAYEESTGAAHKAWQAMPPVSKLAIRPLRALYRMRVAEFKAHAKGNMHLLTEQKTLTPLKKFSTSWTTHVLRR